MPFTQLQPIWNHLFTLVGIPVEAGSRLWQEIILRYNESQRAYHNLTHIAYCYQIAHPFLDMVPDPIAVQLAIWFHDIIYNHRATDNEEQSACYAGAELIQVGVADNLVAEVQRLIRLTQTHQAEPDDGNAHLLLDADLAILGAAAPEYSRYAQAIRQEYAWVSDEVYRQGRGRVLHHFLAREHLFWLPRLCQEREQTARQNIQTELQQL